MKIGGGQFLCVDLTWNDPCISCEPIYIIFPPHSFPPKPLGCKLATFNGLVHHT